VVEGGLNMKNNNGVMRGEAPIMTASFGQYQKRVRNYLRHLSSTSPAAGRQVNPAVQGKGQSDSEKLVVEDQPPNDECLAAPPKDEDIDKWDKENDKVESEVEE
jgi:hypothetical protein